LGWPSLHVGRRIGRNAAAGRRACTTAGCTRSCDGAALDIPTGLAPRALRDIQAGQAAGRFTVPDADIALSAAAGGLLGLLRTGQRHPERTTETTVDQLAEAILRLLGVPAPEAARLAASLSRPPARGSRWPDPLDAHLRAHR
jgi:hypothetical protein